MRAALLLRQPLIITGKPGTGKTRLARELARHLRKDDEYFLPEPLIFHTKTTSTYRDLLYSYDALSHFQMLYKEREKVDSKSTTIISKVEKVDPEGIQPTSVETNTRVRPIGHTIEAADFIQLRALGQAIVLGNREKSSPYREMEELAEMQAKYGFQLNDNPYGCIVLIDEVDKAPRDFTNDLLDELDNFRFTVAEDGHEQYSLQPSQQKLATGQVFVILTSNSEKNLPDAFLRRCIFFHIEDPDEEMLTKIALSQIFPGREEEGPLKESVRQYVDMFVRLRGASLDREPATAELINWMYFLRKYVREGTPFQKVELEDREASFCVLAKNKEDMLRLKEIAL